MEVLVDANGTRLFLNSPRVDQADMKRNLILYDPNGARDMNTGLYERSQPPCQRWVDHFHQYQRQFHVPPAYSLNRDGTTNRPSWQIPQVYRHNPSEYWQ